MGLLDDAHPVAMCTATLVPEPTRGCTPQAFIAALDAAAATGCSGVSLWSMHCAFVGEQGLSRADVLELHRARGLAVHVVEAAMSWASAPGDRDGILREAEPLLDLAVASGARHLLAVTMDPQLRADAHVGLATLCDAAAACGIDVALEFLPWSGIADIATAWRLVQASERTNAGLLLDTWHWQRQPGGPDEATLRAIPPERIHILQLNDAPRTAGGDLLDETMNRRLAPGEGEIDLVRLLRILDEFGVEPLIAPEVFNAQLVATGAGPMARRVVDGTRAVLAAARSATQA